MNKIVFLLCLFITSCNSRGVSQLSSVKNESYELLDKSLPEYGNCKNEKLCVTQINPKTKNYGNNTLSNIPVGNFGLVGYTLKNQTGYNMSPVEVSNGAFPNKQFTEDIYRSTCINNELSPQEECNVLFRYMPINYNELGDIKFRFEADKWTTQYILENYSSRAK